MKVYSNAERRAGKGGQWVWLCRLSRGPKPLAGSWPNTLGGMRPRGYFGHAGQFPIRPIGPDNCLKTMLLAEWPNGLFSLKEWDPQAA